MTRRRFFRFLVGLPVATVTLIPIVAEAAVTVPWRVAAWWASRVSMLSMRGLARKLLCAWRAETIDEDIFSSFAAEDGTEIMTRPQSLSCPLGNSEDA